MNWHENWFCNKQLFVHFKTGDFLLTILKLDRFLVGYIMKKKLLEMPWTSFWLTVILLLGSCSLNAVEAKLPLTNLLMCIIG